MNLRKIFINSSSISWVNIITLIILIYVVAVALKLPIYPDEVAYKIFIERYFYSGGYKQSLTPYCAAGFLVKPPLILLPASIFGSLLTLLGSEWWSYRLAPLLCLVAIIGVLAYINYSSIKKIPWLILALFAITPCLYGLVILRPEVFILLSGLLIYLNGLMMIGKKNQNIFTLLSLMASIFLYSFVSFIHPKSLYLLPLLLLIVIYGALNFKNISSRILFGIIFGALCIHISVSSVELHRVQYLSCPEFKAIEEVMKKQSIVLLELFSDPPNFFNSIKSALNFSYLERAVSQFTFKGSFDVGYLPPINSSNALLLIINLINLFLLIVAITVVIVFNLIGWKFLPTKKYLLVFFLSAGYLTPYMLNLSKNWYENSSLLGSLVILLALINPYLSENTKKLSWLKIRAIHLGFKLLLMVSILGGGFLVAKYFTSAFNNGYVGPGISIAYDRATLGNTIMQFIENYSLNDEPGFISDDLTYEYLKQRELIIPATYLALVGDKPEVVNQALDSNNVRYGITRCITLRSMNPKLNWRIVESRTDPVSKETFCLFKARE